MFQLGCTQFNSQQFLVGAGLHAPAVIPAATGHCGLSAQTDHFRFAPPGAGPTSFLSCKVGSMTSPACSHFESSSARQELKQAREAVSAPQISLFSLPQPPTPQSRWRNPQRRNISEKRWNAESSLGTSEPQCNVGPQFAKGQEDPESSETRHPRSSHGPNVALPRAASTKAAKGDKRINKPLCH